MSYMRLTSEQVQKLASWADEGDRRDGTTAWGPLFSDAMEVAREVRDSHKNHKLLVPPRETEKVCTYCLKEALIIGTGEVCGACIKKHGLYPG